MISTTLLLQTLSFITGLLLAKKAMEQSPKTVDFEKPYKNSKLLWLISLFSITIILLNSFAFHYDAFSLTFPLLYQKYAMIITWGLIVSYLSFMSGFTLYVTHKIKPEKFRAYLVALILLNILLFINHYQKNAYGGNLVKDMNITEQFVKQSTNFSCTSASISTITRGFGMAVSEKKVAELSRLTKLGANAGQVRYALDKLGIKYHTLTGKFEDPNRLKAPAILYVDNPVVGFEGHAIVYLGKNHYGYEVWNPVGFKIYLSEKELREVWHGRGIECSY